MTRTPSIRLDSSRPDARQWTTYATSAQLVLRCDPATLLTTLSAGDDALRTWVDPLDALQWLGSDGRTASGRPMRWAGFLSYDLGRLFENIPSLGRDDLGTPLFAFMALPPEVRSDGVTPPSDRISLVSANAIRSSARPISTFSAGDYRSAVGRVIEYIQAGDIFQANLAQRFSIENALSPAEIYARLLHAAPASYGGLLDFGDFALVCNSPELFFRVTRPDAADTWQITTRPIKGTRPNMAGMEIALRDSIKDQAELNMIVDLERNDLGRICEIASVKVSQPRTIERHPTVYHGVATIQGLLRREVDFVGILRAMFPGGSITGAPKIRAMQIIDEMEPVRRGPYCGAIGYLDPDGSMEFNIAIRTMIVKDGMARISVGGGIVADSDPAAEYEETLVKAKAMFAALGVSMEDLRSGM